jgi:hypothetical protein
MVSGPERVEANSWSVICQLLELPEVLVMEL